MKKSIKNRLLTIAACAISTAMCFGTLAACGGDETPSTTTPEKPEHVAAVAATCEKAGNKEYWKKGGKYYSDEACTKEMTQEETVVAKREHDFTNSTTYGKDATQHWKVCKYEDCTVADTKVNHAYDEDGECACGAENAFVGFNLWQFDENDTDLGASTEYIYNGLKVKATDADGEAWHIKLETSIDARLGGYYEVTYTVKSNMAGLMKFESYDGTAIQDEYQLEEGNNTVTYKFVAGKVEEGKTSAVLQLGALPAGFELEITGFEVNQEVGNFMEGLWTDTNAAATATKTDNADGTITVNATGSGQGWHLKLANDVTLEDGHVYELTMVFVVSGRKDGNLKYVVYDDKASVENDGLCWMDHDGVYVKTFRFTANETCTIGSCLEYGDITNADNPIVLTIGYANLVDATPAAD
ncbi:MAG: hypothetical protein J1F71_05385 [Clostridiales bacterium]|nr:hypothetical protein [Clostridiales bacterium]